MPIHHATLQGRARPCAVRSSSCAPGLPSSVVFGLERLSPGRENALGSLLEGRDTLVLMPTGRGKSLIYQLASFYLPGTTVVVSPLIALMEDQLRRIVTSFDRPNLHFEVRQVAGPMDKLGHLRDLLAAAGGASIVYTGTQAAEELSRALGSGTTITEVSIWQSGGASASRSGAGRARSWNCQEAGRAGRDGAPARAG